MALNNSTNAAAFLLPEQVHELVVVPTTEESVAARVATIAFTNSPEMRFPVITADASSAWTAEGAEIATSSVSANEVVVVPRKIASLVPITNELASDSNPAATELVGQSIARDLARKLDAAFFGNTTPNGPSGLQSVVGVQSIPGGSITNIDPFVDAEFAVGNAGGTITAWACNANTAKTLSKIKQSADSNVPLLQPDATSATKRSINGAPLFVVPGTAIADGLVWGIDTTKVFVVVRQDTTLVVDPSAYFTTDSIAVRATMRVGFAFPDPTVIAKIGAGGS